MPKLVDHNQRRSEIILALWKTIGEYGIDGITLQAVAKTAGISVGRIQHYFASKDDLVQAGCQAMVDGAAEAFTDRSVDRDPWETLTDLVTHPIPLNPRFRLGVALWYAYLAKAAIDPRIGEIIREALSGTLRKTESVLREIGASPKAAPRLMALGRGLTEHVLVGTLTPDEALAQAKAAVEELRPTGPEQK